MNEYSGCSFEYDCMHGEYVTLPQTQFETVRGCIRAEVQLAVHLFFKFELYKASFVRSEVGQQVFHNTRNISFVDKQNVGCKLRCCFKNQSS